MNEDSAKKVQGDIRFIREIIENTTNSITGLGKAFIMLGFIYLGAEIINLLSHFIAPVISSEVFFTISILFAIALISATSWTFYIVYKTPLMGLGKQLINIWACIIIFYFISSILNNALLPNLFNMHSFDNVHISQSLAFLTFAFGFLCMGIFTDFKILKLFSLLFAVVGLFFILPNPLTSIAYLNSNPNYFTLVQIISFGAGFLVPFSFLFIGYYLESKRDRVK